jgi:hypothetical protein
MTNNSIKEKPNNDNDDSIDIHVPESLQHLISSIRQQNKVILVFKFTEKNSKNLYFATSANNNIVKSLENFEKKVRELVPTISNTEYNVLEELILSNIDDSNNQKVNGEEKKKEIKTNKYSRNRKGQLHEAILIDEAPHFVTISDEKTNGEQIKLVSSIDETNRTLLPPSIDEYLHNPYEFTTFEELRNTFTRMDKETTFSLYRKVKSIVAKYIDQQEYIINIIAIDIVFSYFQDRFNTVHYLGIFGGNENGKSSIGDIIEALAYRTLNTTDPSHAVIYRLLGNVEPGQLTLVLDESDRIDQNHDMMAVLKSGYEYSKFVTKTNPNSLVPEKFYSYCSKTLIGEKPPSPNIARGVNDRIFQIITIVGNPKYDIKEILNSTDTGGPEYKRLRTEIEETRKELFAYRLLHFNDPIPNIDIEAKRRDKELTKPYLQLFLNSTTEEENTVYDEVNYTLKKLLEMKNTRKEFTLEAELFPILFPLMHKSKSEIVTFSDVWQEITTKIKGRLNPNKPNEFLTEDYGTIYKNSITFTLERMGVSRKRRSAYIEMLFDENKLIKTANQFNIVVQTNLDSTSRINNDEGYERYEDFKQGSSENKCHNIDKLNEKKEDRINSLSAPANKDESIVMKQNGLQEKNDLEIREGFSNNPSQHSQRSSNTALKDMVKEFIYRIGNTDNWRCKKCSLYGDKWFMQIHPCRGLSDVFV